MGFGYRKIDAPFLYRLVSKSQGPEHLVASNLKPAEVISIIGLSHIVRVAVDYTDSCFMT
jgi:hypothetical protein